MGASLRVCGVPTRVLRQEWAHSCLICTVQDWGPLLPHLHRDWAHPAHIGTGTGLATATSAPGLGLALLRLRRDLGEPAPAYPQALMHDATDFMTHIVNADITALPARCALVPP